MRNKVIVITGATSGIGKATAHVFAEDGYRIIALGRNFQKGIELKEVLNRSGFECEFYQCNLLELNEIDKVSKMILDKYDEIDVLFNNAGVMLDSKEIEKIPIEEWNRTFMTNTNGVFLLTAYLKEAIVKCKGNIINNASIAGLQSYSAGRSYAYSASKAAVIQLSRMMAKNYASEGVRVNCICPGIIDTSILGNRDRNEYAKRVPMGYVGKPEQVASVVKFLASEQANYLTGVVLPIDGGASL